MSRKKLLVVLSLLLLITVAGPAPPRTVQPTPTLVRHVVPPALSKHNLLIITPEEFVSALNDFREHKDQTGMPTEMITLERLYKSFAGADAPESIKKAIAYYHENCGTKYVMLVGDSDKFPVRYTAHAEDYAEEPTNIGFGNSDLYYADLYKFTPQGKVFDDWNYEKNGVHGQYFGELHKKGRINFDHYYGFPDIAVGRIPASNLTEVTRYVKKVIYYETHPHGGKYALIAVSEGGTSEQKVKAYTKDLSDAFKLKGFVPKVLYFGEYAESDPPPNASTINSLISSAPFVTVYAHGNPSGWPDIYSSSDLKNLYNEKSLPVIFSTSCDIARFAPKGGSKSLDIEGKEYPGAGGVVSVFDYTAGTNSITRTDYEGYQRANKIRLAKGNFDSDSNDKELVYVLEYQDGNSTTVALFVYQLSNGKLIRRIGDERFKNASNPSVAVGNFDYDPEDEIVATMKDGAGRLAILVYDYNKKNRKLERIGDVRLGASNAVVATGDFFYEEFRDEIVVTAKDGAGRLAILVYEFGADHKLYRIGDIRLGASNAAVATGDFDSDSRDEIVVTAKDGADRLAILVYDYLGLNYLDRIGDIRLGASNASVATGNFDNDSQDEIVVTVKDGAGRLGILVYNFNKETKFKRIGDIRLEGASNASVATGNFDNDSQDEMTFTMKDGLKRAALLVYDLQGTTNLKRVGDFRVAPEVSASIPTSIVCGNFDQEKATDEIVTFFSRTPYLPKPPAPLQPSKYDPESMAEALLVQSHNNTNSGAIAFVGTNTGAQDWELELGRYFFEAYLEKNAKTVGDMWKYMVRKYYSKHHPALIEQDPDCLKKFQCWVKIAEIFQPAKHLLFGDPSLRVGGVK